MNGFSDIGKKLGSFAGSASKKSGSLMKSAKLNAEISRLQMDIEDAQFELGRAYYENNKENPVDIYAEYITIIRNCEAQIRGCEENLLLIKGMRYCSGCDAVVEAADEFCGKCGARMPVSEEKGKEETLICKNCSEACNSDKKYCNACGFPLK